MSSFIDLTGQTFGLLTVIRREPSRGNTRWLCQCSCGSPPRIVSGQHLREGTTKTCGCKGFMPVLPGDVFDRWTVLAGERRGKTQGRGKTPRLFFRCRCICGNEGVVSVLRLRSGESRSCGCLAREVASQLMSTHGLSRHPLYPSWKHMIERCTDPDNPAFRWYGERGITVCERWRDLRLFIEDMGERPPGMSMDRVDNDGPYAPDNVRWATPKQQRDNRRDST